MGMAAEIDVNKCNKLGVLMLHRAAEYGQAEMARRLLVWRANVDGRKAPTSAFAGQTPLHLAAMRGYTACCEVLLQHRADVHVRDGKGRTPLHFAVMEPV